MGMGAGTALCVRALRVELRRVLLLCVSGREPHSVLLSHVEPLCVLGPPFRAARGN